jgi:hypothetical protein
MGCDAAEAIASSGKGSRGGGGGGRRRKRMELVGMTLAWILLSSCLALFVYERVYTRLNVLVVMTTTVEAAIIIIILRRMWWDQQRPRALDVLQNEKKREIPELSESARRRFVKKRLRPCKKTGGIKGSWLFWWLVKELRAG